jgi:hypothetical protein
MSVVWEDSITEDMIRHLTEDERNAFLQELKDSVSLIKESYDIGNDHPVWGRG